MRGRGRVVKYPRMSFRGSLEPDNASVAEGHAFGTSSPAEGSVRVSQ